MVIIIWIYGAKVLRTLHLKENSILLYDNLKSEKKNFTYVEKNT